MKSKHSGNLSLTIEISLVANKQHSKHGRQSGRHEAGGRAAAEAQLEERWRCFSCLTNVEKTRKRRPNVRQDSGNRFAIATFPSWASMITSSTSLPATVATVAAAAGVLSILVYAYKVFLRPLFPVTMECWFCMRKNRVNHENKVSELILLDHSIGRSRSDLNTNMT